MFKFLDPRHSPLRIKYPLTIAAIVYSVALIAGLVAQVREAAIVRENVEGRARQFAHTLAMTSSDDLARMDYWSLYVTLKEQTGYPDLGMAPLRFGAIVDNEGVVFAHTLPATHRPGLPMSEREAFAGMYPSQETLIRDAHLDGNDVLLASSPVRYLGKEIGYVWLAYDTAFIKQLIRNSIIQIGMVATLLALAGSLLGWLYSRKVVGSLGEMTECAKRIQAGRIDEVVTISPGGDDELGRLITTFNEMVRQLKEKAALNKQLEASEKLAAIGRMVSGVAHEINNPLGGMRSALENLRHFSDDKEKRRRNIELLISGLAQIESVVGGLLAQHRAVGVLVTCEPRYLDELFLLVRHDCERRHIRIDWRNDIRHPFVASRAQLQQVLTNLLVNAIQSMSDGGTLSFSAFMQDSHLNIVVEDTGCGIPQDKLGAIFEPFFTTRAEGTGLGLWITMQLVTAMHGTIEVESSEGQGTRFTVNIPVIVAGEELK